jgi:archaellum component FlaC
VEKEKSKLEKLQAELESLVYEYSNLVDRITTVASELMFYSY